MENTGIHLKRNVNTFDSYYNETLNYKFHLFEKI